MSNETDFTVEKIETTFKIQLPEKYKNFIGKQIYKQYNGNYAWNLPGDNEAKFKVYFDGPDLLRIWSEREMNPKDFQDYIPLATLKGDDRFLVIDINEEQCPVFIFDYEDGDFLAVGNSLMIFCDSLLKKGQRTFSSQRLWNIYYKANKLYAVNDLVAALAELNKVLKKLPFPPQAMIIFEIQKALAFIYNLTGSCYKKLGNIQAAIAAFRKGIECFDRISLPHLSLLEAYCYDTDNFEEAIKLGEACQKETIFEIEDQLFYVNKALAFAYLVIGNYGKAKPLYQQIHSECIRKTDEKIKGVICELKNKIIEAGKPNAHLAEKILSWFGKEKQFDLPPEIIRMNREWWNNLDNYGRGWKLQLLRNLHLEKDPSDVQIAELLEFEALIFKRNEGEYPGYIQDLTPLTRFNNLKIFDFEDLNIRWKDLSPLSHLTRLENLKLEFEAMKYLQDVNPLKDLTRLTRLELSRAKIKDATALGSLCRLKYLSWMLSEVENLPQMDLLKELETLVLSYNKLKDIQMLYPLANLKKLSLHTNEIEDLNPLSNLEQLEYLDFTSNKIKDLTPLKNCIVLRSIYCGGNGGLSGLAVLKDLPNLNLIAGAKTSISKEEIEEFKKLRPDVEVQ